MRLSWSFKTEKVTLPLVLLLCCREVLFRQWDEVRNLRRIKQTPLIFQFISFSITYTQVNEFI